MKFRYLIALAAMLACPAASLKASAIIFQTAPSDGILFGPPGATVGFGYLITNLDPDLWLVTTGLSAGTLSFASGTSLFDFPVIAPGDTVFMPYDSSLGAGLYEIQIDNASPTGFVNSGAFVLSADYYTWDPSFEGVFASHADDQIAEYQITASEDTSVPEPRLLWITGLGLAIFLWRARRPAM